MFWYVCGVASGDGCKRRMSRGSHHTDLQIPNSLNGGLEGYDHRLAQFGIPPGGGKIVAPLYYANSTFCDGKGDTKPTQYPLIFMVDRGSCTFVQKVRVLDSYHL